MHFPPCVALMIRCGRDDDDDDVGEKLAPTEKKSVAAASSVNVAPTSLPSNATESSSVPVSTLSESTPRPAGGPTTSSATSTLATGIPPSSFYGTPAPKQSDKKRKSVSAEINVSVPSRIFASGLT